MRINFAALAAAAVLSSSLAAQPELAAEHQLTEPGLYAVFDTSQGTFIAELFEEEAPRTVENFVGLATGTKPWRAVDKQALLQQLGPRAQEIRSQEEAMQALAGLSQDLPLHENDPYFDGTIFHRLIPGFMIQGGAPRGVANPGASGPGFEIQDEFGAELRHDKPGILSMANSGPNTGGSQFFVTVAPTPHLDGRHAIFGQVVRGQEVVDAIVNVPTGPMDRPATDVTLERVDIVRVGEGATYPRAAAATGSPEATATPSSPE